MSSLTSYSIPNLAQGISQQPDAQRDPSQAEIQVNGMSSIVEGLRKRDCSETIGLVSSSSFVDCLLRLSGAASEESLPISPRITLPMLPAILLRFLPNSPVTADLPCLLNTSIAIV